MSVATEQKTNESEVFEANLLKIIEVDVPEEELQAKCDAKLATVQSTLRLPGYRPGKAPANIINAKFGPSIRAEVVQAIFEEKVKQATEGLKLVEAPSIENVVLEDNKGLKFQIRFETFADFEMPNFGSISLENPVQQEMTQEEIDAELNTLAQTHKTFNEVDVPATAEHAVKISLEGKIEDGQAFPAEPVEKTLLRLNDASVLSQEFNDQMVGKKAGDNFEFSITYAADFNNENIAGKKVNYKVQVHSVHEIITPAVDDELAKTLGYADLEMLKKDIVNSNNQAFKNKAHTLMAMQLFSKLEDLMHFPVPASMQDKELSSILEQMQKFKDSDEDLKNKTQDELVAYAKRFATRRIRVGILLNEYSQRNNIQITNTDLNLALLRHINDMPEFMQSRMLDWYSKNPKQVKALGGEALEHKVVADILANHIKLTDKVCSIKELEEAIEKETMQNMY